MSTGILRQVGDSIMSHPVDDDVVMASAIGRCSNNWAHVETALGKIFCHLTSTNFEIAVTVFSFFKASRTQRDVLRKLSKMTPYVTVELNTRLNAALKTYLKLAEERNELLHNPIGRSVENQVYIMLRKPLPEPGELPYDMKPISPAEIDVLSARIAKLNAEIRIIEASIGSAKYGTSQSYFGDSSE